MKKKPLGFQRYLRKLVKEEGILPLSQVEVNAQNEAHVQMGMKMMNENGDFILHPPQGLNRRMLRSSTEVKEVYKWVKAVKVVLGVKVSSYFLKKVLLSGEFLVRVQQRRKFERFTDHSIMRLLYYFLLLPEIKPIFQHKIDFDALETRLSTKSPSFIPLLQ